MTEKDLRQWLLLYFINAIPPSTLLRLLAHFGNPAEVLSASYRDLRSCGLTSLQIESLQSSSNEPAIEHAILQSLAWGDQQEQHIIVQSDPRYPPLLKEIHDPPLLLFVVGKPAALLYPQIAIVGSRRCSVDGKRNTRYFAEALAKEGFSICSGLARGIDGAAHEGALGVAGTTVAVLGTGVDKIYPQEHHKLADAITATGALVSEMPLGSDAKASHFPKRNRIISGMSLGVIVVEAALRSGSLITARLALEQNRELFAVPGSIRNPLSIGAHRLIQQGAHLVDMPDQVLEHLGSLLDSQIACLSLKRCNANGLSTEVDGGSPMSKEQAQLVAAMGFDPVSLEILVERTGLTLSVVQTCLLNLELEGKAHCDGGHYILR